MAAWHLNKVCACKHRGNECNDPRNARNGERESGDEDKHVVEELEHKVRQEHVDAVQVGGEAVEQAPWWVAVEIGHWGVQQPAYQATQQAQKGGSGKGGACDCE